MERRGVSTRTCSKCGRDIKGVPGITDDGELLCVPCGRVYDKRRLADALNRAAQILINEFSYDGEDPNGVKAYQDDVNWFRKLANELTEKCGHPDAYSANVAFVSPATAASGLHSGMEVMGCTILVDERMTDSMVHFPQPDGTCYRVNA